MYHGDLKPKYTYVKNIIYVVNYVPCGDQNRNK